MKRHVFMISDGTGITVEGLGNSLISQFEGVSFEKFSLPYIDSIEKADEVKNQIKKSFEDTQERPIVFMTLVNPKLSKHIMKAPACYLDFFNTFLTPVEEELKIKSSYTIGRAHAVHNNQTYTNRIEAIDYALSHDDGVKMHEYGMADIILIGVSRCGKTPSCLYLALQFGILAANYPFTDEDIHLHQLPKALMPFKHKLFGLTIDCNRLQEIRHERRPDSQYASVSQCNLEISKVEALYKQENIPYLDSTKYSIEEICTRILAYSGLKRKI